MDYRTALAMLHEIVRPRNYCEIGVRLGYSLVLAKAPAIGIDPDFDIQVPLPPSTRLFKTTSDDFFSQADVRALFGGPIDFAFIDGMHQVEFALRDFMNLERCSHEGGLIAIDDVLPGDLRYATRERYTQIWTGDVYRLIPLLRMYRPDLDIRVYDIEMKGLTLISNLDPASTVLRDAYAAIVSDLAGGRFEAPSAQALRAELAPHPVTELQSDLRELAQRRSEPRA